VRLSKKFRLVHGENSGAFSTLIVRYLQPTACLLRSQNAAVILLICVLLPYSNSLWGPFLFDDISNVVENASIRTPATWLQPPHDSGVGSRPLLNATFGLNYKLHGLETCGYHITNVLIHGTCALLLYGVVRLIMERTPGTAYPRLVALTASIIWAVHPLNTATVSYISQRSEGLMGMLYLLAFYSFLRGITAGQRRGWFVLSVFACWFALLVKEVAVTAPIAVLAYDSLFVVHGLANALRSRPRYYCGLFGSWAVACFSVLTLQSRGVSGSSGVSWLSYALTESEAVLRYLQLTVFPAPLVFDYGVQFRDPGFATATLVCGVLVAVSFTIVVFRKHRLAGFALCVFFLLLAPSSSVVPVVLQPIAENRVYLPSAMLVSVVCAASFQALGLRALKFLTLISIVFAFGTHMRNRDYQSELAIWSDTAKKRPENARAHNSLGYAFMRSGDYASARREYEWALRLKPQFMKAHYNLGSLFLATGETDAAIQELAVAVELAPAYPDAYNNLALAFQRQGKLPEARAILERGCLLAPERYEFYFNLGNILLASGLLEQATQQFTEVLRLNPNFAPAYYRRAVVQFQSGRQEHAVSDLNMALKIKPDWDVALRLLREARSQPSTWEARDGESHSP
jgi:protein O-mannosyl-transferase